MQQDNISCIAKTILHSASFQSRLASAASVSAVLARAAAVGAVALGPLLLDHAVQLGDHCGVLRVCRHVLVLKQVEVGLVVAVMRIQLAAGGRAAEVGRKPGM